MSLIKCNKCGEVYSDSYKKCPFCVEDEEYYNGKVKKRGHRQMEKRKKAPSVVGPVLVLAVLVLVGILVWAFAGDTVRGWFGGDKQPEDVDPDAEPAGQYAGGQRAGGQGTGAGSHVPADGAR